MSIIVFIGGVIGGAIVGAVLAVYFIFRSFTKNFRLY